MRTILISFALMTALNIPNLYAQSTKKSVKPNKVEVVKKQNEEISKTKDKETNFIQDAMYHIKVGYELNNYNSINLTITDQGAEKLETKGIYVGMGIEYELTDFISTTTSPSFSMGSQSRPTYGNNGTNEIKTYAAKINQSLNLNYGSINIFQPFIEAGIGYGWFNHTADWISPTGAKFQSELDAEGMIFEMAVGINLKMINGLMPFVKVGIRKFTMEEETSATASTPGAAQEVAIDTKKEYGSATTVIGLGFEF